MGHWEFPGSPVVTSIAGDTGSIPSQGFRPQVARLAKEKESAGVYLMAQW